MTWLTTLAKLLLIQHDDQAAYLVYREILTQYGQDSGDQFADFRVADGAHPHTVLQEMGHPTGKYRLMRGLVL